MSVLLDINMPTSCFMDNCPCLDKQYGNCQADKEKRYIAGTDRPAWCPLVQLADHGPLIDADELCKLYFNSVDGLTPNDIMRMPVIIKSTNGE